MRVRTVLGQSMRCSLQPRERKVDIALEGVRLHKLMDARALAGEILRCPEFARCHADPASQHPCHTVANWYGSLPDGTTFYPEPWMGHLAVAPILFVASNPGAGMRGEMPDKENWLTSADSTEELVTAADGAFDTGQRPGITDATHYVDRHGKSVGRAIRYWSWCWGRAAELLQRPPAPGVDYAITEAVHCGSRGEEGVREAFATCTALYFDRVLAASPAKVILCTGAWAARAFEERGADFVDDGWGPVTIGGTERLVLRVPHPNRWGKRWALEANVPAHLETARSLLA